MTIVLHPRPNPIIAAMYTLRDLDVDVIVIHGPSGCGFMASRMLEEAGIRVVTTSMVEDDLIFGASEKLYDVIGTVCDRFTPKRIGVVGTCASMIIGEDLSMVRHSQPGVEIILVDVHGCMGDNTQGAIRAMEAACFTGIINEGELGRQRAILQSATDLEKNQGMAHGGYIQPTRGPTKYGVSKRILEILSSGGSVNVVMNAKKELAYRFADINLAIEEASRAVGGDVRHFMNLDPSKGLPRIRRYASDVLDSIRGQGIEPIITGGLDEYAVLGDTIESQLSEHPSDLLVITGIAHAYAGLRIEDIIITDQPRILANFLKGGYISAVGEIASHSLVMGTRSVIPSETGDTIRQMIADQEG